MRLGAPVKDISNSSSDGNLQRVAANTTGPGTQTIESNSESLTSAQAKKTEQQNLPSNQNRGEINWLGSSYTGQDIKVIAHLYGDTENEIKSLIQKLDSDIHYLDSLASGAGNLSSGVLGSIFASGTFSEQKKNIEAAMGISGSSSEDERAKQKLFNNTLYNPGKKNQKDISRIEQMLNSIKTNAQTEKVSLGKKLQDLHTIGDQALSTIVLGTLQTLSIQSAREKYAVRSLGHDYAKAYTRGPRTLAGSMVFTVFEEHPLSKLLKAMSLTNTWKNPNEISTLLPDQIPPIDITIVFANEYGSLSEQRLYGVEFINDSTTYSIENLLSEQIMQFTCRDIDILTSKGFVKLSNAQRFGEDNKQLSGSNLVSSNEQYNSYLDKLGIRRGITNR